MELTFDPNDRGQVGIGTLIVFIAMVLVAAIAAGVLINTAGFLQTQAEDTGTESTEQVANNLNIITTVGDVASGGTTVDTVRLGVQPAAGSDDLNLEELSVQYVSGESFSNLVHIQETSVDDNDQIVGEDTVFTTEAVTAEDGQDNVMTDNSDRYEVIVPHAENIDDVRNAEDGGTQGEDAARGVFYEVVGNASNTNANDPTVNESENEVAVANDTDAAEPNAVAVIKFDEEVDPSGLATYEESLDFGTSSANALNESFVNDLDNGNLNELQQGEEAELTFTTETGAQTVAILQVPDSLAGEDEGDTVDL